MATRARVDMRSKSDVEYMGKHGGGDVESYTCGERPMVFGQVQCGGVGKR